MLDLSSPNHASVSDVVKQAWGAACNRHRHPMPLSSSRRIISGGAGQSAYPRVRTAP